MEILNFIIKLPRSLYYLLNVTHWLTAMLVFGFIVLATCFRPHPQQFACKIIQAWHVVGCYHATEANHKSNYVFGRKKKWKRKVCYFFSSPEQIFSSLSKGIFQLTFIQLFIQALIEQLACAKTDSAEEIQLWINYNFAAQAPLPHPILTNYFAKNNN